MMRELQQWIKSCEEANAVRKDFNKYKFCDFPKKLMKEKEKILHVAPRLNTTVVRRSPHIPAQENHSGMRFYNKYHEHKLLY